MMMQVVALMDLEDEIFADNGLLCGKLYEGGRVQTGCDGALP